MQPSVVIFLVASVTIAGLVIFFRIRLMRDEYYTNTVCRQKIVDATNEYLDKNLATILNERPTMGMLAIRTEIETYIELNYDRQVLVFLNNNKNSIHNLMTKIIVKRVDKIGK